MDNQKTLTVSALRKLLASYDPDDPVYVVHRDTTGDPYLDRTYLTEIVLLSQGNELGLVGMDSVDGRHVAPVGVRIHTTAYETYAKDPTG